MNSLIYGLFFLMLIGLIAVILLTIIRARRNQFSEVREVGAKIRQVTPKVFEHGNLRFTHLVVTADICGKPVTLKARQEELKNLPIGNEVKLLIKGEQIIGIRDV